ncbi:SDR family NAD(P)-dependent oxidoreductase [Chitinophaga alhagiae]|uniref:SDR family NAD(P)-dependent oxidoreductase n=1 Tax=Chitinophaga alhagiae TaxID=2203219 RepID=UPI000E5A6F91|nr:SDR family oxidoreductase [Chitinophaga alhagiae]
MKFKGKTLLISGGLGDIGRAAVAAFLQEGAAVAVGDVLPPAAANLPAGVHYTRVDVADAAAVTAWVAAAEAALGPVDMVIANAATVTVAGLYTITPEQWANELRVNLDGAFYLARAATARMLERKQTGSVVFVGSWAAEKVHAQIPAYAVSKAGMRMLCKTMALELAPHGIMVNELAPGYVDAGVSRKVWEQAPALREEARQKTPVRALITPEEIAQQLVWLCSPQNKHMTGSTLLMDGGLSL